MLLSARFKYGFICAGSGSIVEWAGARAGAFVVATVMGMAFAVGMSMGEDAIGTWGDGDDSIAKIGAAVCGGGGGVWTSFRRLNFISKNGNKNGEL
jgi:hypothetical protein